MAEKEDFRERLRKRTQGLGSDDFRNRLRERLGVEPRADEGGGGRSLVGQFTDTLWAAPKGLVQFGNELQRGATMPIRLGVDVARGRNPVAGGFSGFAERYQPAAVHMAESMRGTGGRVGELGVSLVPGGQRPSETEYGRAVRESRIVPTLFEDVGNVALVTGGVGAGVGRAGRVVAGRAGVPTEVLRAEVAGGREGLARAGGRSRVAEARRAFQSDYVPEFTRREPGTTVARDAVDAADARVLGEHDLAYETGLRPGSAEAAARQAERGVIEVGAEGPGATRRVVNEADAIAARQRADRLTGTARSMFRVEYPVRRAARLGDTVSGDPSLIAQAAARPLRAVGRRVGPPVRAAVEATGPGAAAMQGFRNWRLGHEVRLEASDEFRTEFEGLAHPQVLAMEKASAVLPEPELQTASFLLVDEAVNPALLEAIDNAVATGGVSKADLLDRMYDGDESMVRAHEVAEQHIRGTLDPEVRRRMDEAQSILRPVREQRQQRYVRGYGAKEELSPEGLRERTEQVGSEPLTRVVEEKAGPSERSYDAQAQVVAEARAKADRAAGRRILSPEQYRSEATKQVADTLRQARHHAERIATEAPDVAARALRSTPERLAQRLADPAMRRDVLDSLADSLVVGARSRSEGVREAFALAQEAGFNPPDLSLRRAGAPGMREVERRAGAEQEALGLAKEADRLTAAAERGRRLADEDLGVLPLYPVERQALAVEGLRAREAQAGAQAGEAAERLSSEAARATSRPADLFSSQRPAPAPGTPEFRERLAQQEGAPEAVSGREAQRRVREVRADISARAKQAQADIVHEMSRFEGGRLRWPEGDPQQIGGEWDFLEGLHPDEVARLRRDWGGGVLSPDQIAQAVGMDTEAAMREWLQLTREHAELGKLARYGRVGANDNVLLPLERGQTLNDRLLWRLGEDTDLDLVKSAYDKNVSEGALHLARTAEGARAEWEERAAAFEGEVAAALEPLPDGVREQVTVRFEDTWRRVAAGEGDDFDFASLLDDFEAEALHRAGVGQPGAPSWFEVVQRRTAGERVLLGDEWVADMQGRRRAAEAAGDADAVAWIDGQIAPYVREMPDVAADTAVGGAYREALEAVQAEQEMRGAGVDAPRAETLVSPEAVPFVRQLRAEGRTAAGVADLGQRRQSAAERLRAQGARRGAAAAEQRVFGDLAGRYGSRAERLAEGVLPRYEARAQAAAEQVGRPVEQARRAGEREQAARTAERTLGTEQRRLSVAEERMERTRREAVASPEAAPARYAGALTSAHRLQETLRSFGAELDESTPGAAMVFEMLAGDVADTLAKLTRAGVDPEHLIGGDQWGPKKGAGAGVATPLRRRKAGEQYEKSRTASQSKRTVVGQTQEGLRRATTEARNEVSRDFQQRFGRTAADVLGPDADGLSGQALVNAMADAPLEPGSTHRVEWVPSAPGGLFDEVNVKQVNARTLFVPKPVHDAVFKSTRFDDPNLALRIYDKANNFFRVAWLPLSPRWLTGNIVGNALMGISEVGPTYFRALPEAIRLVRSGEVPNRLTNRGFTRSQRDMLYEGVDIQPVGKVRGAFRGAVERSFAFNEFVDNVSRSAVFVASKRQGASRGQAIKRALRAAGDFQRMTPFERAAVKRVWMFWPWYKHITKLTFSLPVNHPHRVMWTAWLGQTFADPSEQAGLPGFLRGSIPLGDDRYIPIGGLNPFASGANSPLFSTEGAARSLAPTIQLPFAVFFGKDPAKAFGDIARPPGSLRLSEGGGERSTGLWHDPGQLAYFLAGEFPQLRLMQQTGLGRKVLGAPAPHANVVRYPTGEPWFFAGGEAKPTGRTVAGEALGFFGVPYPMTADVAGMHERRREAKGRRETSRENYRERLRSLR